MTEYAHKRTHTRARGAADHTAHARTHGHTDSGTYARTKGRGHTQTRNAANGKVRAAVHAHRRAGTLARTRGFPLGTIELMTPKHEPQKQMESAAAAVAVADAEHSTGDTPVRACVLVCRVRTRVKRYAEDRRGAYRHVCWQHCQLTDIIISPIS